MWERLGSKVLVILFAVLVAGVIESGQLGPWASQQITEGIGEASAWFSSH